MRSLLFMIIAILVIFSLSVADTSSGNDVWEESFFRANQAFKEGRFQDAVDGYEQLISNGHENGHIYYNLGNAFFRLERVGHAILNYERARMLIPRDADLSFNLRHARDQIRDAIEEDKGFVAMAFFWIESLSLSELFRTFGIINLLFWGIIFLRQFNRADWTFYLSITLMIFWLIAGTSFGLRWYQVETDNRAVILTQEADILAGPDDGDTVLFKLHEGTMVHRERSEDGWSLVSLPDEKRGWVKSEALGVLFKG